MENTNQRQKTSLQDHESHLSQLMDMMAHYPDAIPCINIMKAHIKGKIRNAKREQQLELN